MPLTLPTSPAPSSMTWAKISAANVLTPAFGGADQVLNRKGTRWALTFNMPPMTYVQAMPWTDLEAEGDTVLMRVFQPGLVIGNPGAPLANGVSTGTALSIKGLTAGYVIQKGQWLSIVSGGQRFLYRTAAQATASGSGVATVTLGQMLRRPPSNNDVVEIAQPMIEGFVRDVQEMTVGVDRLVAVAFTVRERE